MKFFKFLPILLVSLGIAFLDSCSTTEKPNSSATQKDNLTNNILTQVANEQT